ncbi:MAG: ABC transporter permease subunit [Candidatus Viridilinea halotolerans]|uniref:ABC transporter permease subunit n=1 Tax=Candidatus Viridilinea halotolerans TaxID=2491704 RepID=A0A426UA96_9CHLR|nr:MAG: ABC transporter permease subunit [Candidatus Viridilinea halotolerans]
MIGSSRQTSRVTLVLLYAILIVAILFAAFPIYFVAQASLRPGQSLYSTQLQLLPNDATLANYRYVTTQLPLLRWIGNSLFVAGMTTIVTLVITLSAGYAFSRFKFRGRTQMLGGMLALQAFPGLLSLFAFYLILLNLNLLNNLWGLVLIYASGATVFNIFNLKGYFDTLPADLEEAALIDGATPFQAFFLIMLPLARPAIAVTALFGFLAGFNDYIMAQTMLFDEQLYTAPVGIFSLQDGYRTPWGWFAASALIVSLPVTLLFLYLQRNLVSGLASGAVKG